MTQCHHIGPTPPHTGNRLDSHQCQRGTGKKSHHGHGAHPAHHSNRHWSPTDAALCMSVPPRLFPIRTLRLATRTFHPAEATQSSSSAHTSRTAETEISLAWQYRRNAEDFHSPAAKMTPKGEPAAASEVALPALTDDVRFPRKNCHRQPYQFSLPRKSPRERESCPRPLVRLEGFFSLGVKNHQPPIVLLGVRRRVVHHHLKRERREEVRSKRHYHSRCEQEAAAAATQCLHERRNLNRIGGKQQCIRVVDTFREPVQRHKGRNRGRKPVVDGG